MYIYVVFVRTTFLRRAKIVIFFIIAQWVLIFNLFFNPCQQNIKNQRNCLRFKNKAVYLHISNKLRKEMASAIRAIPTLHGEEAHKFEQEAARVEAHPGKIDCRQEANVVREYLRTIAL